MVEPMDVENPPRGMPLEFAERKVEGECDAFCCCCKKVGRLIVVCEGPNRPGEKRQLCCIVGPYWSVMLLCTTPLIAVPSGAALFYMASRVPLYLTVVYGFGAVFVLGALWKTATTDPGLVVRRHDRPEDGTNKWSYDDRTKTWRPVTARFADDCGVLVDGYDHTCPWTGTAIGAGNIFYFYAFTASLVPLIILLIVCMVLAMSTGY